MTEIQLIGSQDDRIVLHSCACSNESSKTEHSIDVTKTSWKLKDGPTAHAVSHLTHLAWENVTTNLPGGAAAGGSVPTGPGHPHRTLCWQLAAIQQTGLDDWQKLGDRWCLRHSNDLCQVPNATFPHTVPAWRTSVNQINQAKQVCIVPYVTNKPDAALHRDHPPTTYRMPRLPAANSIIG